MATPRTARQELSPFRAIELLIIASLWSLPRLCIIAFAIFSHQIFDGFASWVIPALGFLVLPWTTIAYAFMWSISSDQVYGWEWVVVGFAVLLDILTWSTLRPD